MRERSIALILLTGACMLTLAGPLHADPSYGEGQAGAIQLPTGRQISAVVTVGEGTAPSQPTGPGPETGGAIGESNELITYHWVSTGESCALDTHEPLPDGSPSMLIYWRVRHDRTVDPPVDVQLYEECREAALTPVVPPPPPPPTLTEMSALAQAEIIIPSVNVSPTPDIGGVTGLETWFWYDGQTQASTTASIRGYSVTATMHPVRFYWQTDDPRAGLLESATPGSEASPAARWTYRTKGTYRIRVQAVWDGTWTFTGHGSSASGDLPTIRATGATDYRVDEIRSELTDTR